MLKIIKRVFIALIVITSVVVLSVYFYTKDRTYYSKDSDIGNTLGNIYNGGLFCMQDDTIYFSNDIDGGKLYSMDQFCNNLRKVYDDKAVYINADKYYIYYARANDTKKYNPAFYSMLNNNGLYRIDENGLHLKAYTGDPSAYIILKDNLLFFQRYSANNGYQLSRFKIDGSQERNLIKDAIPYIYEDNRIYFVDNKDGADISFIQLSSYTKKTHIAGTYVYPVPFGNYIYYINTSDNNRIYRMNPDGSEPTLLVKKSCSTYNITNSGKYLYYQTNGLKKDVLGRIDLETFKNETVKKGIYKQINVTEYYVFFKSIDNKKTYRQLSDGKVDVLTFTPKLKAKKKAQS